MADISWMSALWASSAGGSGSTNYDELTNRPVVNVTGSPVVICTLATGVYNINGTWAMTADDTARETLKDDLFYVSNNETECKLTWISAGEIHTYWVPNGGSAADVVEDSIATTDEVLSSLIGSF